MSKENLLERAFILGEKMDDQSLHEAIELYRSFVKISPSHFVAWYNLGILLKRAGLLENAIDSFTEAGQEDDLRIIAAYARLTTLMEAGASLKDEDFPKEFRGEYKGRLGVVGPCHNAANFINWRYPCSVEQIDENAEACSIVCIVEDAKYTIQVYDIMGTLVKYVYRERYGKSTFLRNESGLSEIDAVFLDLPIGTLNLVQIKPTESL